MSLGPLNITLDVLILFTEYLSPQDIGKFRCCRDLRAVLDKYFYSSLRNNETFLAFVLRFESMKTLEGLLATGTNPDLVMVDYQFDRQIYGGNTAKNPSDLPIEVEWELQGRSHLYSAMCLLTPLHIAIRQGNHDMVRLLLDNGANIHALSQQSCRCGAHFTSAFRGQPWWMPLHTAICHGDITMVKLLLANGASFNVAARSLGSSNKTITALHISCLCDSLDVSRLLLDHFRPDIDIEDPWGRSPLGLTLEAGKKRRIFEWLLQQGASIHTAKSKLGDPILLKLFTQKSHSRAYRLLELGADPRVFDHIRTTPLHLCCGVTQSDDNAFLLPDRLRLVKLLVEKGAHVNATVLTTHVTPLMLAAGEGFSPIVEYLIEAGAYVNALSNEGNTALMHACGAPMASLSSNQSVLVVKLLLEKGARVDYQDRNGMTPLDLICRYPGSQTETVSIVRILLAHGAHTKWASGGHGGHTMTYESFLHNNWDVCTLLQKHGEARLSDVELSSILYRSCSVKDPTAIQCALQFKGAHEMICKDVSLLHRALEEDNPGVADILLDVGAPWTFQSAWNSTKGWTCLLQACRVGDIGVVKKLLEAGAGAYLHGDGPTTGINQFSDDGLSPLWLSIKKKRQDLCILLLQNGADPFVTVPKSILCPIQLAINYDLVEVLKEVVKHGLVTIPSASLADIMFTVCGRNPGPVSNTILEIFLSLGVNPNIIMRNHNYGRPLRPMDLLMKRQNYEGMELLHKYGGSSDSDTK
ncbi:ankyrin repeat-containing domain protein [Hypoxylon sp. FL1150]|nr:ankyrin repeat-containing domain protein [Hypoxylon sp. FL1150]